MKSNKQFRIEFDNVTAFFTNRKSTGWFNSIEEVTLKLESSYFENPTIIERERPVSMCLVDAMKLKFGNNATC